MVKETFTLRENDDFIELNKLLQIIGIAQTGGHAKMIITDNLVKVNGELESRKRRKLRPDDIIHCEGKEVKIIAF